MARRGGVALLGLVLLVVGCAGAAPDRAGPPVVPTLIIVTATPGLPAPTGPRTTEQRYFVRAGDSLSSIAARHDVTEAAILRANGLSDPDHLQIGQTLVIPPPEP